MGVLAAPLFRQLLISLLHGEDGAVVRAPFGANAGAVLSAVQQRMLFAEPWCCLRALLAVVQRASSTKWWDPVICFQILLALK